jgi:hypothetical protein
MLECGFSVWRRCFVAESKGAFFFEKIFGNSEWSSGNVRPPAARAMQIILYKIVVPGDDLEAGFCLLRIHRAERVKQAQTPDDLRRHVDRIAVLVIVVHQTAGIPLKVDGPSLVEVDQGLVGQVQETRILGIPVDLQIQVQYPAGIVTPDAEVGGRRTDRFVFREVPSRPCLT